MEVKYLICVGLCVGLAGFATAMVDTPPQRLKKLINDGKCHLVSYGSSTDKTREESISLLFSCKRNTYSQRREIRLAERYIHSTHKFYAWRVKERESKDTNKDIII